MIIILVILSCLGIAQTALPDPLSITWKLAPLATDLTYLNNAAGYASDNEIGYYFGKLNSIQNMRFNFTDGTFTPYPDLYIDRPCVVPLPNGDIYIIGGSPVYEPMGDQAFSYVYKLANGSNAYTRVASLNVGRSQHSCAYDSATNRIYALGGIRQVSNDMNPYEITPAVEYYALDNDTWTLVASRPNYACYFSTINIGDGYIYNFNGYYAGPGPAIALRYSIANDTWTEIGAMNKSNYGQVAVYYEEENIIVLFGGRRAVEPDNDGCEYFNLTSQQMVPFTCLTNDSTIIKTYPFQGTFIPSTRTIHAVSGTKVWTAQFVPVVPVAPTPEPVSTTQPVDAPISNNNGAPLSSQPAPFHVISAAISSRGAIGLTVAAITAALVL